MATGIGLPLTAQGGLTTIVNNGMKSLSMAKLGRIEGLSSLLAQVVTQLGVLTLPANATRLVLSQTGSPPVLESRAPVLDALHPIVLSSGASATYASLTTGPVGLNTAGASPQTTATLTSAPLALDRSHDLPGTSASLLSGAVTLEAGTAQVATNAVITNGPVTLDTRGAHGSTQAVMTASPVSLDSTSAVEATAAVLASNPIHLDVAMDVAATRAVVTGGSVSLNTSNPTPATLVGGAVGLSATHASTGTDFGTITVNGHLITLGLYTGANDAASAAQFMADQVNADGGAPVSAAVDATTHHLTLTSRVAGPAGNFMLDAVSTDGLNYGNEGLTGFTTGSSAAGDAGSTDFGSLSVNGVTTVLGTLANTGQTNHGAALVLADRLNANAANTFVASVGGAGSDALILTAKTAGSAGNLTVSAVTPSSNGSGLDDGALGLGAGQTGTGTDAVLGSTDFGSVTINGVTTVLGTLGNTGASAQSAARFLVDRFNANSANAFSASLGGAAFDQVLLTAPSLGSAGLLNVEASTGSPFNGFSLGASAAGGDATGGTTDFGALTINGVTTVLGTLDTSTSTAQSAAQYLVDQLNANAANDFVASRGGAASDQVVLTSRGSGSASSLHVEGLSHGAQNGFAFGEYITGQDPGSGSTDFGSVSINGVTTVLGSFSNAGLTSHTAAMMLADELNVNPGNRFVATVGGAGMDQLVFSDSSSGAASALSIDSVTGEGFSGLVAGQSATGLDGNSGATDFGSVTINGVTTALGSLANAGQNAQSATQYLVDQLNANAANAFVASVAGASANQIALVARTAGAASPLNVEAVTRGAFNGWTVGSTASGSDGVEGITDFGAVTVNGVRLVLGTLSNAGQTPQSAAQVLVDRLNANAARPFNAAVGGAGSDQIVLSAPEAGSQSILSLSSVTGEPFNGFSTGQRAQGEDASLGVTDFGSVTLNGVTTAFGTLANAGQNSQSAARYLVDRLNANAANGFVASLGGPSNDQIILRSRAAGPAGSLTVSAVAADGNGNAADDGSSGFVAGQSAAGQVAQGGSTDFGSVTINGVTTTFGTLLNQNFTAASAAHFLADRLNATNPGISAAVDSGKLRITSRNRGANSALEVQAVAPDSDGNPSNDMPAGFEVGQRKRGTTVSLAGGTGGASATGTSGTGTPVVDHGQVTYMIQTAQLFTTSVNSYLASLSLEAKQGMGEADNLNQSLDQTLQAMEGSFASLGVSYQGGSLSLDASALSQALTKGPDETMWAFSSFKLFLDPELALHQTTLENMRNATTTTSSTAMDLTRANAAMLAMTNRSNYLKSVLAVTQDAQSAAKSQVTTLQTQLAKLQALTKVS